jgi:hypothetical protein
LEPGSYPINTIMVLRSSSLLRHLFPYLMCATQPKVRK